MQKELEELNIVKILLFVFLYLVIIVLFIIFYTVPEIKTYKTEHIRYKENLKSYYSVLNKHELLKNTLESNKKTYKELLTAFRTPFNQKDFISFSKNYFKEVFVKKTKDIKKEDEFLIYRYKMNYILKDIDSLYKFFDGLKNYPAIIKIDFPFILESSSDNMLKGKCIIEIHESNISI